MPKPLQVVLQAYFAGSPTPEDIEALEAWLLEDISNARVFAEHGQLVWLLLCEQEKTDAATIMLLLREAEEGAPTVLAHAPSVSVQLDTTHVGEEKITLSELRSIVGYAIVEGLRIKAVKLSAAIAAVLVFGVMLFVVFGGPGDTPSLSPLLPNPGIDQKGEAVATLTAHRSAQWQAASGANLPSIGDALVAGQRLTLTQGFAEITTRRGAVAILEAPCAIEMIDNANALRLITGKLVGHCETDSSKGFLVRTPHMDVTDLGTRFGVDATSAAATEVHVFEGEVNVAMQAGNNLGTIQEQLTAGHAVRAEAAANGFVEIDENRLLFAAINAFENSFLPPGASEVGIAALSGDVAWSPGSAYLGIEQTKWRQDDRAYIFQELAAYRLDADVPVSLIGPGSSEDIDPSLPTKTIQAGTRVRTYIVLLYPESSNQKAQPRGSVTFEGEVLGIATRADQSRVLANMVGGPARLAPIKNSKNAWIDVDHPGLVQDVVALGDDGRTVTFAFSGGALGTDAVRVFVRVPEDE